MVELVITIGISIPDRVYVPIKRVKCYPTMTKGYGFRGAPVPPNMKGQLAFASRMPRGTTSAGTASSITSAKPTVNRMGSWTWARSPSPTK